LLICRQERWKGGKMEKWKDGKRKWKKGKIEMMEINR
jgi:hypothetical protein